jgi:hypothetical protein
MNSKDKNDGLWGGDEGGCQIKSKEDQSEEGTSEDLARL